jgi:chromosome segregation ATPase
MPDSDNWHWLRGEIAQLRMDTSAHNAKLAAVHERLDAQAKAINEHSDDIDELEKQQQELQGMGKAIRWIWAVIAAIASFFGIHIAVTHK